MWQVEPNPAKPNAQLISGCVRGFQVAIALEKGGRLNGICRQTHVNALELSTENAK
jgi:hypothetical protein